MPQGRVWSVKYGSISSIRKNQLEFIFQPRSVQWVKELIRDKIENQMALMLTLAPDKDDRINRIVRSAINGMEDHKNKIMKAEGAVISEIAPSLRGWEGAASRKYFEVLNEMLPQKYQFSGRSKQPATDMVNALLNYGYGMLYGKIEGALIKAGIDPYVGVFHRDDYNRPVLVFDIIEKFRVWIDYVVMRLCLEDAFIEECFQVKNGAYWLDGLGKRILIQSVNDYLAEIVPMNGLDRSRATHIDLYGHQLAKFFTDHKM
jgi:CRISPR-associated protein Cas1